MLQVIPSLCGLHESWFHHLFLGRPTLLVPIWLYSFTNLGSMCSLFLSSLSTCIYNPMIDNTFIFSCIDLILICISSFVLWSYNIYSANGLQVFIPAAFILLYALPEKPNFTALLLTFSFIISRRFSYSFNP